MKRRDNLFLIGILTVVCALFVFVGCSNESSSDGGGGENSDKSYSAATVETVGMDTVSGKTFSFTSETASVSVTFTVVFAPGGASGTLWVNTTEYGTVAYEGNILTLSFTSSGGTTERYYLRKVNGEIYLLSLYRWVKEDGSDGFYGKYVCENGTPPPDAEEYVIFSRDGTWQNSSSTTEAWVDRYGTRHGTWTCNTNGIIRGWMPSPDNTEETVDSGKIFYDGTKFISIIACLFSPVS